MQCPKCGGRGYISEYSYVAGGMCFECNGKGTVERIARGRATRTASTPEEKRMKREAAIIADEIASAGKRAGQLGSDGQKILAQYASMPRSTVGEARQYAEAINSACYRLEVAAIKRAIALDELIRNDSADCAHWGEYVRQ